MEKKKRTKKCDCGYVKGVFEPCAVHKAEIAERAKAAQKKDPIPSPFMDTNLGTGDTHIKVVNMTGDDLPPALKEAMDAFTKTLEKNGIEGKVVAEKVNVPVGTRGSSPAGGFDFNAGRGGLGSIAKTLGKYLKNNNDDDCGDPYCTVHNRKQFSPFTKERFDQVVDKMRSVAIDGEDGFVIVGKKIKPLNSSPHTVGAVLGTLKVNNVHPAHVLLTVIEEMGLTRDQAIKLISDSRYDTLTESRVDF